ncbi:MAG: DUF2231 domain-containing protein [Bacteroidota bacterium]
MKILTLNFFLLLFLLFFPIIAYSFQTHDHQHETDTSQQDTSITSTDSILNESSLTRGEYEYAGKFASFEKFPNLHPLFVHFPVVLLGLAFFTQLFSFFLWKKELSVATLLLLLIGFIGALLSANWFHPHVSAESMQGQLKEVFFLHEKLANWTQWLAGVGLFIKLVSHFLFRRNNVSEAISFMLIAGAVVFVSLTGHLGSQMVFLEGVGPRGNHLEIHEQDHDH